MLGHGSLFILLASTALTVRADDWLPENDNGWDLTSYVSRPDIRAPKLVFTTYEKDAVEPGYIFTAPYNEYTQQPVTGNYQPYQIGPHIYDLNGDLIWSGADMGDNRNTFDFKPTTINGTTHLTYILRRSFKTNVPQIKSFFYILNSQYEVVNRIKMDPEFNLHEFTTINGGETFLRICTVHMPNKTLPSGQHIELKDTCVCEVDAHGRKIFQFCPTDRLSTNETFYKVPEPNTPAGNEAWDLFHTNSVDKFPGGSYLLSIRFTNGIYKVNKKGNLEWRLGGKLSDFQQDFNFSGQHDARILSKNETVTVMSFLDNAAYEAAREKTIAPPTSSFSSLKVVALYDTEEPKRAVLLKQYDRPDHELSRLRGNGKVLPNGGAFINWSWQGHFTELTVDDHVVLEGQWATQRFHSYRIFKAPFVGRPMWPPALKALVSRNDASGTSTTFYVSWNGATEVNSWEFFGSNVEGREKKLGYAMRTGFETSFVSRKEWRYVRAQALDVNGTILGTSVTQEVVQHEGTGLIAGIDYQNSTDSQHEKFNTVTAFSKGQSAMAQMGPFLQTLHGIAAVCMIIVAAILVFWLVSTRRLRWKLLAPFGRNYWVAASDLEKTALRRSSVSSSSSADG